MTTRLRRNAFALIVGTLVLLGATPAPDGRHDFDFEVGTWTMSPSGSTHIVERLWDGATIARLVVNKPAHGVRGSLLTVYHADSKRWYIYWVSATDGSVSAPLVGRFSNGIGTFVGPDTENGRRILVRVVFSDVSTRSFKTVQSISHDAGKTWETVNTTTYTKRSS